MSTAGGGGAQTAVQNYGIGSSLDTGNSGFPGITIPASGGLGLRCMLIGDNNQLPSCWVLQNGDVYSTNTSRTITQITTPEPIIGLFTSTSEPLYNLSDIMGVGASGAIYNLGSPSLIVSTLPIKPSFCGYIVEAISELRAFGAYYVSGEGKAYRYASVDTWVGGVLQVVSSWTEVVLSQVKPGTPNTPLPFDNLSMLYSGVVV